MKATPTSSDRINLQWTNTATERLWWDISVTDGRGRNTAHSLTGVGRGDQSRGTPASHVFIGLQPNQTLCLRIKVRTAAKTEGCVSKLDSVSGELL